MNQILMSSKRSLVNALIFAVAIQLTGLAVPAQTLPTSLNIITVEGEGATGRVRQQPSHIAMVRVVDQNQKPVSGAAVVFTLPTEGATGVFGNGSKTLMVITGANGAATAKGFRFNQIPGKVPVNVNVSYKGLTARASVTQVSEAPAGYKPHTAGGHTGTVIAIIAVLAAGGAGGALYAMRGSSSSTSTVPPATVQPIGITPGTGTLAPPR